jgi:hypothetical protein
LPFRPPAADNSIMLMELRGVEIEGEMVQLSTQKLSNGIYFIKTISQI